MSDLIEVTFKVPKGRTVTHAGKPVADGDKRKCTPAQAEWLAERGLITQAPKAGKSKAS